MCPADQLGFQSLVPPHFQALPTERILFFFRNKIDQEKDVQAWKRSKRFIEMIAEGEKEDLLQGEENPSEIQTSLREECSN